LPLEHSPSGQSRGDVVAPRMAPQKGNVLYDPSISIESNAAYWYRRARKPVSRASLDEEWTEIAGELLKDQG
jgi:hypothetical protein